MAVISGERINLRRERLLGEAPGAYAKARFVRVAPMKARRVIDLIRGLSAMEAMTALRFAPQAASQPIAKVLASAVANAENNERLDPQLLHVTQAFVDEGPTLKRIQPRAQGRAYRIRKRTCHITVVVEAVTPEPAGKAKKKKAKANDRPKSASRSIKDGQAQASKPKKAVKTESKTAGKSSGESSDAATKGSAE